jgi:small-conductance mechanosensitive channel
MASDLTLTIIQVVVLIAVFLLIAKVISVSLGIVLQSIFRLSKRRIAGYRRKINIVLLVVGTVLTLILLGVNSYIIYQGNNVLEFQLTLLEKIPEDFWISAAVSSAKCILLLLLTKLVQFPIRQGIRTLSVKAQNYDQIQGNDQSINEFFDFLSRVVSAGIWIGAAILCTQFLGLPAVVASVLYWILATFLTICLGLLVVKATPILVDTLDSLALQYKDSEGLLQFYERFRHLLPLLRRCLELVVYLITVSIILQYTDPVAWLSQYAYQIVGLIGIYFISRLFIELTSVTVDEFVRHTDGLTEVQKQRRLTVAPLCKNFLKYFVYFGALIAALNVLQIDPTPILAGAGILGVAVGFGAQSLIEDIVSGFLILFENYYLVGDYIQAGRLEERTIEGFVEAIELRTTQVRHPDGQLQIIRNGEVGSIVNYSKLYIYAAVDIPLAYETDLDQAYSILETVGQKLQSNYPDIVIEPTQIEGIESLGKSLILVRTITKVKPGKHLYIQRLLRKQLKEAFDQAKIELSDYEPEVSSD